MGEMHMSLSSLHIHKAVLKAFVGAQHLQRNNILNVTTSSTYQLLERNNIFNVTTFSDDAMQ